MLIWSGLILIAINLVVGWRLRRIPHKITALGLVIGAWLIASEFVPADQHGRVMGVALVFGGGVYLMALSGLALRAYLDKQRVQTPGAVRPASGTSVPSVRAPSKADGG
jgi:hypothetical protein